MSQEGLDTIKSTSLKGLSLSSHLIRGVEKDSDDAISLLYPFNACHYQYHSQSVVLTQAKVNFSNASIRSMLPIISQ